MPPRKKSRKQSRGSTASKSNTTNTIERNVTSTSTPELSTETNITLDPTTATEIPTTEIPTTESTASSTTSQQHEISSDEEAYVEENSSLSLNNLNLAKSNSMNSAIAPYESLGIQIAGYADITKYESFYGNPDKNNVYLPTAKANNDAKNWLFQVGRIMKIAKIPENEKVNAVTTKFQGSALDWLVRLEASGVVLEQLNWLEFQDKFRQEFCSATETFDRSYSYQLLGLKLTKDLTIAEYTQKFYDIKAQLGTIPESFSLALYTHGLPIFMRKEIDSRRITQLNLVRQAAETIANNNYELMAQASTYDMVELHTLNYDERVKKRLQRKKFFRRENNNNNNNNRYNGNRRNNNYYSYKGRNNYGFRNNDNRSGNGNRNRYNNNGYNRNNNGNNNNNNKNRFRNDFNGYFSSGGRGGNRNSTNNNRARNKQFNTLRTEESNLADIANNEWGNPLLNNSNNNTSFYMSDSNFNHDNYFFNALDIELHNNINLVNFSSLHFDSINLPNTESLGLAPLMIEGMTQTEGLLDTGATADALSLQACTDLGLIDNIIEFTQPQLARAVNTQVSLIGYIKIDFEITVTRGIIKDKRCFFVINSSSNIIILGLPFIKKWKEQLLIEDFFKKTNRKLEYYPNTTLSIPQVSITMFQYNENYIKTLLNTKENAYFLCYINRVDTNTDTIEEEQHIKADVEMNTPHINRLRERILNDFSDVVTNEAPTILPPTRGKDHRILLIEPTKIISRKQYPLSYQEQEELTKQVDELLKNGFIQESMSPYNSPILFVKKKDGTMRMCVDYRLLNNNTVKDKFPLPKIEIITSRLAKAQVYSKLDLMAGYYQVRINKKDIEKTAFSTDYGHYEWVVMPFGLTNAPATFQRLMNQLLKPFIGKFVQVYLDDIFIYSPNESQHYHHVREVLQTLRNNKWIAKLKKCAFFFKEVKFLGMIITPDGIKTDPEKTIKIKQWPIPKNIKEAQSFIGLATYYRRFVKDFGKIAAPIHQYIGKKSTWSILQQNAFEELKNKLTTSPVLVHPIWDSHYCFLVHTDACGIALGYTLEQLDPTGKSRGVIAYGSRKLKDAETRYSIYDREFLAVIEALKTWKYYLCNRHFIIRSDHKSLVYLKNQNLIDSTRVAKWLDYLSTYDFEIQYIKGKENSAADALSRYPSYNVLEILQHEFNIEEEKVKLTMVNTSDHISSISTLVPNQQLKEEIILGYKKDSVYSTIYFTLKYNQPVPISIHNHIKHYKFQDDLLYYTTLTNKPKYRLLIPKINQLINKFIANAHSNLDAGHFGTWKTYLNLADSYYWRSMVTSIKRFCNTCIICQRCNPNTQKIQGLFTPLPIPEGRWTDVTMDFVTGIPKSQVGNDMIMVIIDRMTKMGHFIPCEKTLTPQQCARLFIDYSFKLHGIPQRLVTDKDIRFVTKFWQTIHFLLGTSLLFSTTNHPQTDGQTENLNKTLFTMLRKYCHNDFTRWDQYLSSVEFAYNSTYQDSIKATPFQLAIGYNPDSFKHVTTDIADNKFSLGAENYYKKMKQVLQYAQDNLVQAQSIQEKFHNRNRRIHNYLVGDLILLNKEAFGSNPAYSKIQPSFHGPYKLVKKYNDNAFEVDLPTMNKKHRIINVQWFKPYEEPVYITNRVPITDAEVRYRINDMTGIAGYDLKNKTYDVYWQDSNPNHATTITKQQFELASPSLRQCLLYNSRLIKELEEDKDS